jgi:hypothetical protein
VAIDEQAVDAGASERDRRDEASRPGTDDHDRPVRQRFVDVLSSHATFFIRQYVV